MNFLDMRTEVWQLIGDEVGVQFKAAQVNRYLNAAQKYVAGELEIYQSTLTTLTPSPDTNYKVGGFLLPETVIRPLRVMWLSGATYVEVPWLQRFPYNEEFSQPAATYSGIPDNYYITNNLLSNLSTLGRRIEFYPSVSPTYTIPGIHIVYSAYPPDMAADGDISPLPTALHEIIVMYALSRCKMQENDYEGAQFIMKEEVRNRMAQLQYETGIVGPQYASLMPYET